MLAYYEDFFGYKSVNIPGVWRYGNALLTSVHPEANSCTPAQDSDCPPAGTLTATEIQQNHAWLATYVNQVAQTSFKIPAVPVAPRFNTTAPHSTYPAKACDAAGGAGGVHATGRAGAGGAGGGALVFCDDFDSMRGRVPEGLSPRWQRNQTDYSHVRPWNTSFISSWGGHDYTSAYQGDGYAVVVPQATAKYAASITSQRFSTKGCQGGSVAVRYAYTGHTLAGGYFRTEYAAMAAGSNAPPAFKVLKSAALNPAPKGWAPASFAVEVAAAEAEGQVRFTCVAGSAASNFCALDSVTVTCA